MKKFILNLIKFSFIFLFIPVGIYIVDPYDYYESTLKMDIDRMELFRRFNVADWALVEVGKIDQDLKGDVKTCAIGDSRSRLLISGGHRGGWMTRICGQDLDALDLSFGGANLDESFSILDKEINKLEELGTIIVSVPVDRLLIENHKYNRIETSNFNSPLSEIKYLTDINIVNTIIDNREKILENVEEIQNDTVKAKRIREEKSTNIKIQNEKIKADKTDPEQIKWRNRVREFKRNRFKESQKDTTKTAQENADKIAQGEPLRQSFIRKFRLGNRTLFDENLALLKPKLSNLNGKYKVIILIPPYEDRLYGNIIKDYHDDYKYYVNTLKELPYTVFNLQEISDQFSFGDPVHGNFLNGSLLYKLNHNPKILYPD